MCEILKNVGGNGIFLLLITILIHKLFDILTIFVTFLHIELYRVISCGLNSSFSDLLKSRSPSGGHVNLTSLSHSQQNVLVSILLQVTPSIRFRTGRAVKLRTLGLLRPVIVWTYHMQTQF